VFSFNSNLNLYQQTKGVIQNITVKLDEVFKRLIDEKSYQTYFVAGKKEANGRFIIPPSANPADMMVQYQHFINLMINLQEFFEKTGAVHNLLFQATNNLDLVLTSPWLYATYSDWAVTYSDLYDEMIHLDAIPFLQRVSSVHGAQRELSRLIPLNKNQVMEKVQANPFYLAYANNKHTWKNILHGTEAKFIALQKILNDLNMKLPKGGEANVTIQRTIRDIVLVLQASNKFSNSPKEILDVVRLVLVVYPKISSLIRDVPQTLVSLSSEFKDYFLLSVQQINLIFSELIVNLDQIEIHNQFKQGVLLSLTFAEMLEIINMVTGAFSSFLKDVPESFVAIGSVLRNHSFAMLGQVTSILQDLLKKNKLNTFSIKRNDSMSSLLIAFNDVIEASGYKFLENEKYPYNLKVLISRDSMLASQQDINPRLLERVESLKETIQQHDAKLKREDPQQFFKKMRIRTYQAAIEERINELKAGSSSWYSWSDLREVKISLLEMLAVKIEVTASIHDALDDMGKENKKARKTIHLLWQGKTGAMMTKLVNENQISNQNIVDAISIEIERLKTERSKRQIWFEKARMKSIEDSITALQKFKKAMLNPEYLLRTALHEMNANYPQDYQVLKTKQKKLLAELHELDSHIPKVMDRKKPINLLSVDAPLPKLSPEQIQYKFGYALAEISERIAELSAELEAGYYFPSIKTNKILLLNELREKLPGCASLHEVLEQIESDSRFKNIYYLLHEGRTGAMITDIGYALAPLADQINYLDVQILRLHRLRSEPYSFLEQRRYVEERIFAISRLQTLMSKYPSITFEAVLSGLSKVDRFVLENYEQDVMARVTQWHEANVALTIYRIANPVEEPVPVNYIAVVARQPAQSPVKIKHNVKDDIFYAGIVGQLLLVETTIAKMLAEVMDQHIYAQYFKNAKKDAQGKYDLLVNKNEPYWVHYYKQSFNFLISLRSLVEQVAKLHVPLIEYHKNKNWVQLANTMTVGVWGLMHSYKALYLDLEALNIFPFLQRFTSGDEIRKILYGMVPENARRMKDAVIRHSLKLAIHSQEAGWIVVDREELNKALDSIEQGLVNPDGVAIVIVPATKSIIRDISNIIKSLRHFAASSGSSVAIIKLLYNIYPSLLDISRNYKQAYASSKFLFYSQLKLTLQQVNSIFIEMMVGLDKFKLDSFLTDVGPGELRAYQFKAGISINTIFETFNTLVEKAGFKFNPDEIYPYSLVLQEKRRLFQFDPNVPAELPSRKLQNMMSLVQLQFAEELLQKRIEDFKTKKQKSIKIIDLLDQRIFQLEEEVSRWYNFKKIKNIKIQLLKQLKVRMTGKSFDDAMADMRRDDSLSQDMYYLFEGRTGQVFKTIERIQCSPQGVQRILDQEIARLTAESNRFFFFQSNRTRLLKSIVGLQELKAILGEGGYRIDGALTALYGKFPENYQAVVVTEANFLAELRDIDQYIPDHEIGKIPIRSALG
jgi:hypothetical protein